MWLDLATSLEQGRDRTLNNRARRLLEKLDTGEASAAGQLAARYRSFADATPEGHLVQVFDLAGNRLCGQGVDFPWPAIADRDHEYHGNIELRGRYFRVFVRPAKLFGEPVRVFVAGQLEDNRQQVQHFTEGLLRSLPVLVLVSGLAGYFVSRRALNPIARLIESGRSITIGNLSRRLPVSDSGDELARLAETWNGMLSRLEAAVNRITRFTADASHELRSPLSYIRMASESMLRQPELDPDSAEAFREIVEEAQSATRLLDDMLMLARSDAGHVEVAFETVNLCDVVIEVASRITVMAEAKQQSLQKQIAAEELSVSGDATLLRRLAWILLDNAIKYTPSGGRIEASVTRTGKSVLFQVADSGRGISADSLQHIFDRFYRADPARSDEEGTGLGLAIAKWIADTHGAEVRVTSTQGVGTTFQLVFPMNRAV